MTDSRREDILNEVIGYLVELVDVNETIHILRNLGVTDYELVHDLDFFESDVYKGGGMTMIDRFNLKRLEVENYFVDEYKEIVNNIYYAYSDYLDETDDNERKERALSIVGDIERAMGIKTCATEVMQILKVNINEILMEIEDESREEWKFDTQISEIYVHLMKVLRGY